MLILLMLSVIFMFAFTFTGLRHLGCIGWLLFALFWLLNTPHYLHISDYFNTCLMIVASILFTLIGLTVLRTKRIELMREVTSFSALATLFYFPFALIPYLKHSLIGLVASHTCWLGYVLGFDFYKLSYNEIAYNGRKVGLILACTGIESMALFAGATLGIKADWGRKFKAFLISVPVIYVLNILRNVFVLVAYGEMWFGDDSFYIAHNVISKVLATLALVLISLGVFRFLPELADLIYGLKEEIVHVWFRENGS